MEIEDQFQQYYQKKASFLFSAPGRTELSGNHTDHQRGRVLAAAVNLDTKAAVCPRKDEVIRIKSDGYDYFEINLNWLKCVPAEKGTTSALVRGLAARFAQLGKQLVGFDAYITSSVLPGSGLSSSAAFEVLIATILNTLADCGFTPVQLAQIGQYAENVYFGKPSGLMDQMASSVGNIIAIDFADPKKPFVEALSFDFSTSGCSLCIIDSGADHADLTDEYASIPEEMRKVSGCFGKKVLCEVSEEAFYQALPAVRREVGDRAVLRAIHFFEENKRVEKQVEALKRNDFAQFLRLVTESGKSSWMLLQNVIPAGRITCQELAFALAVCEKELHGRGACRVHGGGFAGTIQAFVPNEMLDEFKHNMERVLGIGSCHVLKIRHEGGKTEKIK